ncbi:MAG: hypothetical protein B7Z02_01865 [Rhodobacterales bacterium 32-67-9]|nr:MAG: hypothetical protein B7Z02_01865 [Rhodobacterales bacterium 32-67-9]
MTPGNFGNCQIAELGLPLILEIVAVWRGSSATILILIAGEMADRHAKYRGLPGGVPGLRPGQPVRPGPPNFFACPKNPLHIAGGFG